MFVLTWEIDHTQHQFNGKFVGHLRLNTSKHIQWLPSDLVTMKRWLATHTPAKASLSASEYSLRELGAAIGIDFNIIKNIVTCLNLPERFDTASGELRTVWPEVVVREFLAVEFKGDETSFIDLTGVDGDDERGLFVAQGGGLEAFEPDSQPQPPSEQRQRDHQFQTQPQIPSEQQIQQQVQQEAQR
ncbi:hypothetical protein ACHAPM_011640 [Fusarium culmorum]